MTEAPHPPRAIPPRSSSRWPFLLFGAAFLLGAFLRLWNIAGESAWLDEALTLQHLEAPGIRRFWEALRQVDGSYAMGPVYYTLEYGWAQIFGAGVLPMRALSLLSGLASLLLLHRIARRLYGNAAAAVACLCLACSLPHIFYSQEIRRYAFECLVVLAAFYTLLRIPDRPRWRYANLFLNAVMLLTSPYCAPLLLVQAAYLVYAKSLPRRAWSGWCVANACFVLGVAALAWLLRGKTAFWMAPPALRDLVNAFIVYAGGRFSNDNPAPYLPGGVSLDTGLATLLYAAMAGALLWAWTRPNGEQRQHRAHAMLLLGWLAAAPVGWFLLALLWKPCFLYRYYLWAAFPLYIAAGAAYAALPGSRMRGAFLLAILALFAFQNTVRFRTPFRPDYQAFQTMLKKEDPIQPLVLVLKEPLNTLPAQVYHIPVFRIAHGETDLFDSTREIMGWHYPAWTLLWRWDRCDDYEAFLHAEGIQFSRRQFGGMPPLLVYHIGEQFHPYAPQ